MLFATCSNVQRTLIVQHYICMSESRVDAMMMVMHVVGCKKWLNVSNKRNVKHCNRVSHVSNFAQCIFRFFFPSTFYSVSDIFVKRIEFAVVICVYEKTTTPITIWLVTLNTLTWNKHIYKFTFSPIQMVHKWEEKNTIANRKRNLIDGNVSTKAHQMSFQMKSFVGISNRWLSS